MYTGNYECLELFVKPDEGKRQCAPENVKKKAQQRQKRTETYLWKLDQISGKQKYRI